MAYEISNYSVKVTLVAASDLSSKQYHFVLLDANGNVDKVDPVNFGPNDRAIGILQNDPTAGQEAEVLVVGGSKLVAGGAIGEGALIGTTGEGKGSALTASGTAGSNIPYFFATSLTEASGANELITVVANCATSTRAI